MITTNAGEECEVLGAISKTRQASYFKNRGWQKLIEAENEAFVSDNTKC